MTMYFSSVAAMEDVLTSLECWSRIDDAHKQNTAQRYIKALHEMTTREPFNFTTFPTSNQDMITLAPIPFYTLCAHHVVPFFGKAFISYVPDEKLAGLSKFARAVKYCAKGMFVQEELTHDIADFLEDALKPRGIGVILQAEHMCMAMRGVEMAGVVTTTSAMRGVYGDHTKTAKSEFMSLVGKGLS